MGSPYSYLAAERVNQLFPEPPEWRPILLGGLFKRFERSSWADGPDREEGLAECERRAAAYGLQPFRWPDPWPSNTLFAMRVATYANQGGKTVAFSLAGFRQAFAGGRDLADRDSVLIAAAAAELHPRAVLANVERDAVKEELKRATQEAGDLGVRGVPSVVVDGDVYWGDDRLDEAASAARG